MSHQDSYRSLCAILLYLQIIWLNRCNYLGAVYNLVWLILTKTQLPGTDILTEHFTRFADMMAMALLTKYTQIALKFCIHFLLYLFI